MPLVTSVDEFLDTVRKSGVVELDVLEDRLAAWRGAGGLPDGPRPLASALIKAGLLTPFQARFLLQGKWRNLVLSGKYRLLNMIGAGGMGNVYVAEHTIMRRKVALKVLPTHLTERPSAVQRFYREARAVAALDHPNIVRAHDVDREGALHFIVLEYVEGVSLQELVKQDGPLEPGRAAHYICQVAAGLQHAHESGWVHRDIKPGNLLIDRNGMMKILDLGLARLFEDDGEQLTREHDGKAVLGTADYLAPEQAMSSEVDIRADLYSLGCTLYFLLVGHPPFPTGNASHKLMAHQMRQPTPIAELRQGLPEGLQAVVARLLEKDPASRHQTPAEVVEALLPFAQQTGPQCQPLNFVLRLGQGPSSASLSGSGSRLGFSGVALPSSDNPVTRPLRTPPDTTPEHRPIAPLPAEQPVAPATTPARRPRPGLVPALVAVAVLSTLTAAAALLYPLLAARDPAPQQSSPAGR